MGGGGGGGLWEHFGNDNFTRIIGQENGRKSEYWGELSTREPEARGTTLLGVLSSLAAGEGCTVEA